MVTNPIMTTRELAAYIKLNEKTVIRMAQTKKIPGVKIGNQWRFHLASIDRYLQTDLMESSDNDLDLIIKTKESAIPLSRLTEDSFIEMNSLAKSQEETLIELSEMAYRGGLTSSKKTLFKELGQREKMLSTAIGSGIAFPHPRHPSTKLFKEPKIIIVRSKKGVQYDAPDSRPVNIFFMPCAPNEFVHIRLLAKISKFLHFSGGIDKFMNAKSKEQIMRLLLKFDRKHLSFDD